MQYHYLLSGLPELHFDSKAPNMEQLLSLMQELLSKKDWQLVELILKDPQNLPLPEEAEETTLSEYDQHINLYYEQGEHCSNAFLREWFRFNRDMNNYLTGIVCKKYKLDLSKYIIGKMPEEISPEIIDLDGISNLYERERRQDLIRWIWLEEHTGFKTFDIENVLVYLMQAQILNRWSKISQEKGQQRFDEMIDVINKQISI